MTRKLAPQEKQARRPIQKACVFCHEKHLQCDLGRPCQNCSKRSIGNTCRDKQRKPRRSDQKRRKGDVSEPRKRKYTQTTRRLGIARLAMSSSSEPGKSINPENSFISKSGNSSTSFDDFDAKKMDGSIDSMEIFAPERGMESNSESEDDDPDVTSVMPNAVDDVVSTTDEGEKLSPTVPHTPSLLKISPLGKISSLTNLLIPSNEQLFPSSVLVNHSTNNSRMENPGTAPSQDISNKAAMSNVKNSSGSSFGSIWANNEYMKLNDILGSPVIPNNGNGHLQYSLPSDLKMDNYIPEFDSGDSNNNYGLRRSSSRPHISLDMASSSQLINGGLNESVSPEVIEKELSPFKFRQLVKSPEDLYEKRWLIKPHNYRAAYRDLSGYLRQRFLSGEKDSGKTYGSKQLQNIAQSMTTHYSPIFVTLTTNLVENDLEMQELVLQRTLLEYESMAKLTNCTPMCIWRRSGELCYVSNEFVSLTGFSRYDMLSQRRFILEFLDDESVVDYFDIFHERLAFGSKEGIGGTCDGQAVFSECNLLLKDGSFLKCACVWTVKRDSFNIPLLVMGQFLPIFDFIRK